RDGPPCPGRGPSAARGPQRPARSQLGYVHRLLFGPLFPSRPPRRRAAGHCGLGSVTSCAALVASNLEQARARIRAAGGQDVRIVAVTKGFGADAVAAARQAGLTDLGENYADELVAKWEAGPRWHFLGAIQRNK